MSAAEIKRFSEDLNTNKEMLEELKNIGNDVEKIVAYANAKGYDISVADIEAGKEGELSEKQLDNVAGGGTIVYSHGFVTG